MVTARTQPSPDELRHEIDRTRALTSKPFGVNLTLSFAARDMAYGDWVRAIVDSGVKIVETAGNNPRALIEAFKEHGITIVHKCTSIRHALSAQRYGADIISIDGFEAAGHPGEDDVPGLVLLPLACEQLDAPVLASGGIADGRGMAAALSLGADGVNIGTRFMMTKESPIHENVKQALLGANERDTILIKRTFRHTGRFYKNAVSEEIVAMEHRPQGATYEDIQHLLAGSRGRAAMRSGDVHGGLICASQTIGLIDDIPSCEELVSRMVAQCRTALGAALKASDALTNHYA